MEIKISESSFEICDDCAWYAGWVGLSQGDIYINGIPSGYYLAAWYPNTERSADIVITTISSSREATMSLGLKCSPEDLKSLAPDEPENMPWEYDKLMFGPFVRPSEIAANPQALTALSWANEVIRQDPGLFKYIIDPNFKLSTVGPKGEDELHA